MSVQENVLQRGSSLTYPSTKPIASKTHMEVQVHNSTTDVWDVVSVDDYDLITNSCVFNVDYDLSDYDLVNVRVGDTPNDLATQPSDIGIVSGIADEIVTVAGISDEVVTVAGIEAEVVTTAGMETQIRDVTSELLRQSIIDAEGNADSAEQSAVDAEASHQATLLVEPEVIAEGAIQVQAVSDEGDAQVVNVQAAGEVAVDKAGEADASSRTADSWANAPKDTEVILYTWDVVNNVITSAPIPNSRSAFHWEEVAKTVSAGLTYRGTWSMDATCTLPANDTELGAFYVVDAVDPACTTYMVGDWLIWNSTSWDRAPASIDWSAVHGVTVNGLPPANGQDLLPTTGGTMTGDIIMENEKGIRVLDTSALPAGLFSCDSSGNVRIGIYDALGAWLGDGLSIARDGRVGFKTQVPYSDNAPQGVADLTRKDYVDNAILALNPVGSVVFRMDAINPATIYGGTWALITGDASLSFGDGTVQDGLVDLGVNDPAVPLSAHSHNRGDMEISGEFQFRALDDTSNNLLNSGTGAFADQIWGGNRFSTQVPLVSEVVDQDNGKILFKASDNWTGSTSSEGISSPVMDVRGARISINVWQRLT